MQLLDTTTRIRFIALGLIHLVVACLIYISPTGIDGFKHFEIHFDQTTFFAPDCQTFCGGVPWALIQQPHKGSDFSNTPAASAFCGGACNFATYIAYFFRPRIAYQNHTPTIQTFCGGVARHGSILVFCRGTISQFNNCVIFCQSIGDDLTGASVPSAFVTYLHFWAHRISSWTFCGGVSGLTDIGSFWIQFWFNTDRLHGSQFGTFCRGVHIRTSVIAPLFQTFIHLPYWGYCCPSCGTRELRFCSLPFPPWDWITETLQLSGLGIPLHRFYAGFGCGPWYNIHGSLFWTFCRGVSSNTAGVPNSRPLQLVSECRLALLDNWYSRSHFTDTLIAGTFCSGVTPSFHIHGFPRGFCRGPHNNSSLDSRFTGLLRHFTLFAGSFCSGDTFSLHTHGFLRGFCRGPHNNSFLASRFTGFLHLFTLFAGSFCSGGTIHFTFQQFGVQLVQLFSAQIQTNTHGRSHWLQLSFFNRGIILCSLLLVFCLHISRRLGRWYQLQRTVAGFELAPGLHLVERPLKVPSPSAVATRIAKDAPGPKSGHSKFRGWSLLLALTLMVSVTTPWSGGEGGNRTMPVTDTPDDWISNFVQQAGVKPHGMQPGMSLGSIDWPSAHTQVRKRGYKRAILRAFEQGMTWYRGRLMRLQDFHITDQLWQALHRKAPRPVTTGHLQDMRKCHRHHQKRRFLRVLQWNVSGLSAAKLDELRLWMQGQNIDVGVFVETRWGFTQEWEDQDWSYVHSGDSKSSGILCMVSRSVSRLTTLRWTEVCVGRLVHVQLRFGTRNFDVLAAYQHTNAGAQRRLEHRKTFWNCLDQYLGTLSKRHILCLLGDFNCSLPHSPMQVGVTRFHWRNHLTSGTQHPDEGHFLAIVRAHGLSALNSFQAQLGPTFVNGNACSRIDYMFTRLANASGHAKNISYLWNAPFLQQTHQGHVPMLGEVMRMWIPPPTNTLNAGITAQQRQQGREAFFHNHADWQQFLDRSEVALQTFFHQTLPNDPELIPKLHAVASDCFKASFPAIRANGQPAAWQCNRSLILNKWVHRARFLHPTVVSAKNVFSTWFHVTQFLRLRKLHKRQAWKVRQERFDQVIAQAQHAASRFDSHQLFKIINAFAPKQSRRRMQLRNVKGSLASPVEELSILKAFVAKSWAGPPTVPVPPALPGMPFTERDVFLALRAIPATKAVAQPFAPGIIWKEQAHVVAPHLFQILASWWQGTESYVPSSWRDSWLLLIPKPLKAPVVPEALRPLALQEPLGKCIIGILSRVAQQDSADFFSQLPFWGYLPARSTQHALQRVGNHCRAARSLTASQRPTAFNRVNQLPSFTVCGAIQLLIDLKRAFDTVCRTTLFSRLGEVGVNPRVVQLLASWHCNTQYHIKTNHATSAVRVGSGVRQGCKAAPFLFNAFLALVISDLTLDIDFEWLCCHLDLYADDFHIGCLFYSELELRRILGYLGLILHGLQTRGLTINTSKSMVLLTMAGTSYRPARAKLVQRTPEGEKITIPGPAGVSFDIPLAKKATYLGCVISYTSMAEDTLAHRLSLSRTAYHRLKKWLTARRGMPAQTRIRLWQTCIWPVLVYGIFTTGLTVTGLQQIQTHVFSMLRQILHNHSYRTHMTHEQVLEHWHLSHPLVLLWQAADTLHRSVTQSLPALPLTDIAHRVDWHSLQQVKDFIWQQYLSGLPSPGAGLPGPDAAEVPTLYCDQCGFMCQHVSVLRRHHTLVHTVRTTRKYVPHLGDHMLDGLPQCMHCLQQFTTWRSFHAHVQRGCQVLNPPKIQHDLPTGVDWPQECPMEPDRAMRAQAPLSDKDLAHVLDQEFGPRLLTLLQKRHWTQILKDRAACKYLSNRCVLCGQYVGRSHSMHQHMQLTHPVDHEMIQMKSVQLTNMHSTETPCSACGMYFVKMHSCKVWYQLATLLVHGASVDPTTKSLSTEAILTCEICGIRKPDSATLHLHLLEVHKLVSSTWNESRDSLAGQPACNHCNCLFETMEGLRSHINQGRCREFNPHAPTESVPVLDQWFHACCKGQLLQTLQSADVRRRLTLHCQCCVKSYTRASDLMNHLQLCHGYLWNVAQPLAYQLVAQHYGSLGCVCNPSCQLHRLNHMCVPLLQMAMQFHRLDQAIFQPLELTDTMLAQLIPQRLPRALSFRLEKCLIQYDLQPLWTDEPVLTAMSHQCMLCDYLGTAAALYLHLHEAHSCSKQLIQMYVKQLEPIMQTVMKVDHTCFACGQVFNHRPGDDTDSPPVVRAQLVQDHFLAQCPVALQLASLLTLAHHGRGGGLAYGRTLRPGHPSLQTDGSLPGQHLEADSESRCHKAAKTCRSDEGQQILTTPGTASPGACREADGSLGSQLGSRHADAQKGGHLYPVLQSQRKHRLLAEAFESGRRLAQQGDHGVIIIPDDAPATTPGPALAAGSDGSHPTPGGCPGGIGLDASRSQDSDDPPRSNLSLSGVECPKAGHAGGSETGHQLAKDAPDLHRASGHDAGPEHHSALPRSSHEGLQSHCALEVAAGVAGGSALGADLLPQPIERVEPDGHVNETTQSVSKPHGGAPGDHVGASPERKGEWKGQRQGQKEVAPQVTEPAMEDSEDLTRQEMQQILSHMSLANPNNWCFANAAFHSFLWCLLSMSHFRSEMFGVHCRPLVTFLKQLRTQQGNLSCEGFFTEILQSWGPAAMAELAYSVSQQDAAEFVQHWLTLVGCAELDMRWEKRVERDSVVTVADHHNQHTPICFQFPDYATLLPHCDLTALGTTWHQVDGMISALTNAAPGICIHLDRCMKGPRGRILKCASRLGSDEEVYLPIFLDAGLDFDHLGYTIVAMMAHVGTDGAGHYRAALKVQPLVISQVQPIHWLLTDDWRSPEAVWALPPWFESNITMVWMVRTDVLQLHAYSPQQAAPISDLMRLLSEHQKENE